MELLDVMSKEYNMDYNLINNDKKVALALLSFLDLGEKLDKVNNKNEAKEIMIKLNNIYWSDIFNYYEMSELPSVKDIMEEYFNIINKYWSEDIINKVKTDACELIGEDLVYDLLLLGQNNLFYEIYERPYSWIKLEDGDKEKIMNYHID